MFQNIAELHLHSFCNNEIEIDDYNVFVSGNYILQTIKNDSCFVFTSKNLITKEEQSSSCQWPTCPGDETFRVDLGDISEFGKFSFSRRHNAWIGVIGVNAFEIRPSN